MPSRDYKRKSSSIQTIGPYSPELTLLRAECSRLTSSALPRCIVGQIKRSAGIANIIGSVFFSYKTNHDMDSVLFIIRINFDNF